jgi:hypothetical protein
MNRGRMGFRHTANAVVVPAVRAGQDVAPTRCRRGAHRTASILVPIAAVGKTSTAACAAR